MAPKLGILAGRGDLPATLIEACQASGRDFFLIGFTGETDAELLRPHPHAWVSLAGVGSLFQNLHKAGCHEVVLAGAVTRPSFSNMRPDWRGMKLLPKVITAARAGDDALMNLLISELEIEGFTVVGAHDLVPDLVASAGPLGGLLPDDKQSSDIARGLDVLLALGPYDVGQAVIVSNGQVMGIEAAEGTARLIARCGELQAERDKNAVTAGNKGVLVKIAKPGQERRADLPTIGRETVKQIADAGLGGIAVEAGGSLVLQPEQIGPDADKAGIFVFGVTVEHEG